MTTIHWILIGMTVASLVGTLVFLYFDALLNRWYGDDEFESAYCTDCGDSDCNDCKDTVNLQNIPETTFLAGPPKGYIHNPDNDTTPIDQYNKPT